MTSINKKDFRTQQLTNLQAAMHTTQAEATVLTNLLFETDIWQTAQTIGTTISNPIELPTGGIIERALQDNKQVYLPKTMPHRQMAFLEYPGHSQLVKNSFRLLEPAYDETKMNQAVDLMIVPGVAFAQDSHYRVGFGGGYYDRFLANYRGHTVALVPQVMNFETANWPVEDFDIAIDYLITASN